MSAVDPAEPVSRFIFSSSHISRENNRVKHNAFMPSAGETSIFRTAQLTGQEIWTIGQEISVARAQQLHARGDLIVNHVLSLPLQVDPSEPPPRHAIITGWPEGKELIKQKAMELAAKAALHLPS